MLEWMFFVLPFISVGDVEHYQLDRTNSQRGVTSGVSVTEVVEVLPDEIHFKQKTDLRTLLGRRSIDETMVVDKYYFTDEFLEDLRTSNFVTLSNVTATLEGFQQGCYFVKLYDFTNQPDKVEDLVIKQRVCPKLGGIRGVVWYQMTGQRSGARFQLAFKRR